MAPTKNRHLNDEIVAEILSRLPAKSFTRIKCACKAWLGITSDPRYKKFPPTVSGLFFTIPDQGFLPFRMGRKDIKYVSLSAGDDVAIDTTLSFLPRLFSLEIISSCNGLLLCRSWDPPGLSVVLDVPLAPKRYFICNPATREWAAVPCSSAEKPVALGFDPRLSSHYHILRFNQDHGLEIFSSKTGEWIKSQVGVHDVYDYFTVRATFLGGIFYLRNAQNQLLGVDLEGKISRIIDLPASNGNGHVGHSEGYLHYMLKAGDDIKIWILKDEWTLKHRISIKHMVERHGIQSSSEKYGIEYPALSLPPAGQIPFHHERPDGYSQILEFHPDADILFLLVESKVFSYYLNSDKLEEVCNLNLSSILKPFVYSPSLSKGFAVEGA